MFLLGCAGVFWLALAVESPDIADADAVTVVVGAVRAYLLDGSACLYGAVEADDIVVSDVLETPVAMPVAYGGSADVAPLGGGTAMDDDFGDLSHLYCASSVSPCSFNCSLVMR